MPIVTPPKIIQNAMDDFLAPLLKNKPQRKHLANYLTGLMSAEMPNASDQSCLNRFLTEVKWDENAVNEARIDWLQQFDDTKFHPRGVIAIDDVLLDKTGKFIKPYILYGGTFWDHAESRYKHAQDLIIVNYVHPTSKKHYPLEFKRYFKATAQPGAIRPSAADFVFVNRNNTLLKILYWDGDGDLPCRRTAHAHCVRFALDADRLEETGRRLRWNGTFPFGTGTG